MNALRRANLRDPLVEYMLGPEGSHALETVTVAGHPQQVFKGSPGFIVRPWTLVSDCWSYRTSSN